MAFTSDIFKTYVGPSDERFCIEMWIHSGDAAMVEITEYDQRCEETSKIILTLEIEDLAKLATAFNEALESIGGGQ